MRLISLLAAAGLVYAAYTMLSDRNHAPRPRRHLPPPRPGSSGAADDNTVRDAGRENTLRPLQDWDEVDEASDESFPASDPPARW
jgi:hypothetical protein